MGEHSGCARTPSIVHIHSRIHIHTYLHTHTHILMYTPPCTPPTHTHILTHSYTHTKKNTLEIVKGQQKWEGERKFNRMKRTMTHCIYT